MSALAAVEPRRPAQRRAERRVRVRMVGRWVAWIVLFLFLVGPLLWQLSTSLKGPSDDLFAATPSLVPSDPTLGNYQRVAEIVPVWRFAANSLMVGLMAVVGNVVGCATAGYALAVMRFRGRGVALAVFLGALLVPAEVIVIAQFLLAQSLHLNNTLLGVVAPMAVQALNVLLMRNSFRSIPRSLGEAAMLDGANAWQRFLRVALPSAKGTLTVVAIFSFVAAWDDFLWPLIVLSDQSKYTLTVGLNYLQGTFANNPRVVAAGTIVAVVPLVVLFFLLQRFFFRGVGEGGVKG